MVAGVARVLLVWRCLYGVALGLLTVPALVPPLLRTIVYAPSPAYDAYREGPPLAAFSVTFFAGVVTSVLVACLARTRPAAAVRLAVANDCILWVLLALAVALSRAGSPNVVARAYAGAFELAFLLWPLLAEGLALGLYLWLFAEVKSGPADGCVNQR